jgi:hypothetical protein
VVGDGPVGDRDVQGVGVVLPVAYVAGLRGSEGLFIVGAHPNLLWKNPLLRG